MQGQCALQTGILTSFQNLMDRIIHNSLTHITKLVRLNGEKDSNMRPTDGKRNLPRFFFKYLLSALHVCPLWQADVKPTSHFRPHLLQHVTTDFWDGCDDSSSQLKQVLR